LAALAEVSPKVRVGLHTTEPHLWSEGYVGVGVHRANRICAVGHGGQVLLSRSTAGLAADEELEGIGLLDLGEHRLKGIERPERIFQLTIDAHIASGAPSVGSESCASSTPPTSSPTRTRSGLRPCRTA
jgi:class 3 adenylate cyclase